MDDKGQLTQDITCTSTGSGVTSNVHWTGIVFDNLVNFDGGFKIILLPGGMYITPRILISFRIEINLLLTHPLINEQPTFLYQWWVYFAERFNARMIRNIFAAAVSQSERSYGEYPNQLMNPDNDSTLNPTTTSG